MKLIASVFLFVACLTPGNTFAYNPVALMPEDLHCKTCDTDFLRPLLPQVDEEEDTLIDAIRNTFYPTLHPTEGFSKAKEDARLIRQGGAEAGRTYRRLVESLDERDFLQLQGNYEALLDLGFKSFDAQRLLWALDGLGSVEAGNKRLDLPPLSKKDRASYPDKVRDAYAIRNGFDAGQDRIDLNDLLAQPEEELLKRLHDWGIDPQEAKGTLRRIMLKKYGKGYKDKFLPKGLEQGDYDFRHLDKFPEKHFKKIYQMENEELERLFKGKQSIQNLDQERILNKPN